MAHFKHLSLSDRIIVHRMLSGNNPLSAIAQTLGRDRNTVVREIKGNRTPVFTGSISGASNDCAKLKVCHVKGLCERCLSSRRICHMCGRCNALCRDFIPARCMRLLHPPFCCNGCLKTRNCTIRRFVYDAGKAHEKARARLTDVRSGTLLSETELARTDRLVSPLLRNGQSVHHIYLSHRDELFCSEKSLYHLIDQGLLSARNLDLRLKVKRRMPRRKPEHKVDRACREGRTYADFRLLLEAAPDLPVVQMDSVLGSLESVKVLLTLFFPRAQLLLCRIRDYNTARSALDAIDALEGLLGQDRFRRLFPVLLTDNGSEFSNPAALERDRRTRVFYCDPLQTNQKSGVERAHEFIRMVRKKGSSFDDLCQQDIDKLCSHINSYRRDSLIGRCPFDAFEFLYGEGILNELGVTKIGADEIVLTPRLLPLPH